VFSGMTLDGWDGLDELEDRTRALHSRSAGEATAFRRCGSRAGPYPREKHGNILARPLYAPRK